VTRSAAHHAQDQDEEARGTATPSSRSSSWSRWFGGSAWTIPSASTPASSLCSPRTCSPSTSGSAGPVLRWTAWVFVAATTYLYIAAAYGSVAAAVMHCRHAGPVRHRHRRHPAPDQAAHQPCRPHQDRADIAGQVVARATHDLPARAPHGPVARHQLSRRIHAGIPASARGIPPPALRPLAVGVGARFPPGPSSPPAHGRRHCPYSAGGQRVTARRLRHAADRGHDADPGRRRTR
jgi:hypothetical protein